MEIKREPDLEEKLKILSDAAKYDVACTSSGVDRKGEKGSLGNSRAWGICHSFAADGRCISLLKVLLSNDCIYDCKYCINRRSNQRIRTSFTPEELCTITIEFYKRNYIEGLFLSSGVLKSPTYTMELMYQTLFLLRTQYHFRGYIHAKAVPGAAPEITKKAFSFLPPAKITRLSLDLWARSGSRSGTTGCLLEKPPPWSVISAISICQEIFFPHPVKKAAG